MNDERCPYESATVEAEGRINTNEVCIFKLLQKQAKQKGFKAGKSFCDKCKKPVDVGTFTGPSVSSLTEIKK